MIAMDRFIRRENIKHYRELLKTVKNEAERQRILKLLAEEQQKQKDAGDPIED
jgi:rubrerythrin